jgi:hypothetical protein
MVAASHTPATWNDILSTTFHNYHKTLTDNIWMSRPLLDYYMSKGRLRLVSGGISIVEPLITTEGETQAYTGYDPVFINPVPTATAAQYDWKQLAATIIISGLEEAQNNSKEMIINLLEAKIMQAEETLKTRLNKMLYGTYVPRTTGGVNETGKIFLGLPTLIDNTTPVGGIDPATNPFWKSVEVAGGPVDAAGLEALLRTAFNQASDVGSDHVDAIFTNAFGLGFYESTLTPQVRYTDTKKANLGFQNLMYKNVPIFQDPDCSGGTEGTLSLTSATYYGINSKYVGLVIHSDRNFKQSKFTDNLAGSVTEGGGSGVATASALDARVSFITTFGNQITRARRRLFKITGVSEVVTP